MQTYVQTGSMISLVLRLTLGGVLLPHGYQKITNFNNVLYHLQHDYQVPAFLAVIVILTEFIAPILLIAGVGSRIMALLLILLMTGAIIMGNHLQHGFFMNWFGNQKGEGFEYHLLAIGIGLAIITLGSGKWSADALLFKKATN
jgi:putative oxidoreductase